MGEREPETDHSRPIERVHEAIDRRLPYLFVAPAVLLVAGLLVYPVLWAVDLSLHAVPVYDLDAQTYVGLGNYRAVLTDPTFARVLRNTVVFVGASVVGQLTVGLTLAILLDGEWPGPRLTRLFRACMILPWATTGVVVAFSWQFMFDPRLGLVNALLRGLGVTNPPAWLESVEWAMVGVVVANVWRGVPFSLVFQTSALESIPSRLYEAAAVGSASRLQVFRHVTLPLLWPFVVMNLLLITIFTVNAFDVVFVMTGGGPLRATEVLSVNMYETAFDVGRFGRANALAIVLFAINLVLSGIYLSGVGGRTRGWR